MPTIAISNRWLRHVVLAVATSLGLAYPVWGDEFQDFVKPLLRAKCVKCHGGEDVNADIDFTKIADRAQMLSKAEMIKEMIDVVGANDMPPEDEAAIGPRDRLRLLSELKNMLRDAASQEPARAEQVRRLNRFQYNNTVKDLFQLELDVFQLPEKLMTRHSNYLAKPTDKLPARVRVASHTLAPQRGMADVRPFPKDLRAAHGYDNQANQLTLSPLLLDAFLRLSVSIIESPDFNEQNVGVWDAFFKQPDQGAEFENEVRQRLAWLLPVAFRRRLDEATLDRYQAYALAKIERGASFTDAMKKVASAALSSPLFLLRTTPVDGDSDQFALASRLSYYLWASGPDRQLLRLAETGRLSDPDVLKATIERMLADPKVERFLDTFPSQWMQLENTLAVTPDPQRHRYFRLSNSPPASVHMVLEPLLLFDAAFVENRPISDLLTPAFSYQSDFLKSWYASDLRPPQVDRNTIAEENRRGDQIRENLQDRIGSAQTELDALLTPIRTRLLEEQRRTGDRKPIDLKPYSAWEFEGDLRDSLRDLHLKPHGKVEFSDGMAVLNRSYLLSDPLPMDLREKTLEVWFQLDNLDQRGGGVMGIQGPGDFFDTIVLGERKPRHWISGSNGFSRTTDFPASEPETRTGSPLHLAMVYAKDGTTSLYRDGQPYGKPYRKGSATFPKGRSSVIFGLRHLPPGGNKFLNVSIERARLYDRALTAEEVAASARDDGYFVSQKDLLAALTPDQKSRREVLLKSIAESQATLKQVPPRRDPAAEQRKANQRFEDDLRNKLRSHVFERTPAKDPRYGGVITNAAMLSMTSGPKRTHPIARGAWIIEVIFNDPPPPPPNDVPPLDEDDDSANLTVRERFAAHRKNPNCAGCHSRLDPLGFALENFDVTGRWRDKYDNGRAVDSSGKLMRKYAFDDVAAFKSAIVQEQERFAKAFTAHLLRFALSRELNAADSLTVDAIVSRTAEKSFRLRDLVREVALSDSFSRVGAP